MGAVLAFPSVYRDYTDTFRERRRHATLPDEVKTDLSRYEEDWSEKMNENRLIPISNFMGADEVFPGIWIGSYASAHDNFFDEEDIDAVLNMAKECESKSARPGMRFVKIGIEDGKVSPPGVFTKAADVIESVVPGGNILVHCAAGVSRSATAVLAYLNRYQDIPWREGLELIRESRPCVNPHPYLYRSLVRDLGSSFLL